MGCQLQLKNRNKVGHISRLRGEKHFSRLCPPSSVTNLGRVDNLNDCGARDAETNQGITNLVQNNGKLGLVHPRLPEGVGGFCRIDMASPECASVRMLGVGKLIQVRHRFSDVPEGSERGSYTAYVRKPLIGLGYLRR